MAYSLKKTSETVAQLYIASFAGVTGFTVTIAKLTPKTYLWTNYIATDSTDDGTITDNSDGTYAISAAGTYSFAFPVDGVFKIGIVVAGTGAGTFVHYTVINSELKELLKDQLTNNIYCHPEVAFDCSDNIDAVYNTNILALLSLSYFAEDINVAFDYANRTTGLLYSGYKYECSSASGGSGDFAAGTTLLLMDEDFNTLAASTDIVLNTIYTCIQTGTPDAWDTGVLNPMTTELTARFNLMADSIDRVDEYSESCATKNTCQC